LHHTISRTWGRERLAQRHRHRLALASIAPHNLRVTPELSDDDKMILTELLRETIDRDRFPLSPRARSYKAILDKLAPPRRAATRANAGTEAAGRAQRIVDEKTAAVVVVVPPRETVRAIC
jgi:hypothetical protein